MKNSWSSTLILGLMIPCLIFLFTSAPAPASGYVDDQSFSVPFGGFHLTEEDPVDIILAISSTDCNLDVTNNGPGDIMIFVLVPSGSPPVTTYELGAGRSMAVGVAKGSSAGVGLIPRTGKKASGTYTVVP